MSIPTYIDEKNLLKKARILVCIDSPHQEHSLYESITDRYEFIEPHDDLDDLEFDLCITDYDFFKKNRRNLIRIKNDSLPVSLPILLLVNDERPLRENGVVWNMIDDILEISVPEKILNARIENMLRARQYSLQLKQTNDRLEKEKEKYQLLTENATDMVSRHDPGGIFTYVSPASEKLTGFTPDELVGKSMLDFMHPDDRSRAVEVHMSNLNNPGIETLEYRFKTKQGTYKWVEVILRAIQDDEDNRILEVQGSTRSIEERKKYEEELYREKKFTDTIINSLPTLFCMMDEDLNLISWNDTFEQVLGYSAEELRSITPDQVFSPNDMELVEPKIREVFETGEAELDVDVTCKNGDVKHHYIIWKKFNSDGKTFIIATGIDITDRVDTESRLKESEKRWEQLVQKNPGLVQIIVDDTIQYINPAGARIYGVGNAEVLIGKSWLQFINADEKALIKDRIDSVMAGGVSPPKVHRAWTSDGKDRYVELQSVPVLYQDKQAMLTIGQEVTDRIEYEEELKRTLKEKEVLLAEIHHRVKNNLAIVSGLLDMQAMEIDDEEVRGILTNSQLRIQSIAKVHEMIYRQNNLNQIDFGAYLQELTQSLEIMAQNEQKDIRFILDLSSVMLNIGQAVPCGMIMNELLTNSIKHAFKNRDTGVVSIYLYEINGRIQIFMMDDGVGIPDPSGFMDQQTLGTTILNLLVNQLKADFDYSTDHGTQFEISFQKEKYNGPLGKSE